MAMLAERKQKVKWCLNPRGNDWAKDDNKFGQRMLEKMGWEPGTGLGAKGQGRTDFVRIQIKNDTKGLGNKEKLDETWIRQQENFDSLLAKLNGADKNDKDADSANISSLEDKSKKSKARVHYHKFTRGKDVSKYSSKDLNCIIGIGGKQSEDSSEQSTETTNSMYDYFNKKMETANKVLHDEESYTEVSDSFTYIEMPEESNEIEESENFYDSQVKKGKKKAKRKASENEKNDNFNIITLENSSFRETGISLKKKKKKKRKEYTENSENNDIDENEREIGNSWNDEIKIKPLEDSNNDIEDKPIKKKKKKCHKNIEKSAE